MRIASITMIGQFPDGIDFHVRNLRWALTKEDHIFIITLPEFIKSFDLKSNEQVTYIPFDGAPATGFINFWGHFSSLVKQNNIDPEYFLFIEEDIFFTSQNIKPNPNPKTIQAFLPCGKYRNIMLDNELYHSRIWEGAQLIHSDLVRGAIDFGVNFSFVKETFLDKKREIYEKRLGGPITMSMYQHPDTMDEFGLYCALECQTKIQHDVKAVHMRGPESMHRLYPDAYRHATADRIKEIQKKLPYIDVLMVIGMYYTVGLWSDIKDLNWKKAQIESKQDIEKLLQRGKEWMTFNELTRLDSIRLLMNG